MNPQPLSVVVNVKNGEHTLNRCLSSLQKFTDVVVFDNYSTDKTIEIAASYPNVTIVEHEFCGMGKVRNLAAAQAKNDWVLFVDCDEVLHPDLVQIVLSTEFVRGNIYLIKRQNYFANSLVNSSSWENDWIKRLFNRKDTRFAQNEVHDSFEVNDQIKYIKISTGFIYHFPYATVSELINKMQFYSTLYAKQHFNKKNPYLWMIPFRAFFMFIKCYILKRGFLDGFAGFAISSYNAMGVFSKYIKLYELYNNLVVGLAFKIDTLEDLTALMSKVNCQSLLPQFIYIMVSQGIMDKAHDSIPQLSQLCMLNKIIPLVASDDWKKQIQNTEKLDYMVYLEDNGLLTDQNLLKKCKKKIMKKKQMTNIQLINLR